MNLLLPKGSVATAVLHTCLLGRGAVAAYFVP